jgi:hypothetical protein
MAHVVQRADVRMRERGDGLGFALEALPQIRISRDMCGQNFDRDGAVQPRVARFVDFAL